MNYILDLYFKNVHLYKINRVVLAYLFIQLTKHEL